MGPGSDRGGRRSPETAGRDSGPKCVRGHFSAHGFCINFQGKMVLSKFRYVSEKMGGDNGTPQVWLVNSAEKKGEKRVVFCAANLLDK